MHHDLDKNTHPYRIGRFSWRRLPRWIGLYILGGLTYGALEILCRGYTHVSMVLLGGLCFVLLLYIASKPYRLFIKCLLGTCIITGLEFLVGYIVNIKMNLDVWNYSTRPLNIMGQICPQFSILWFFLSGAVFVIYAWVMDTYRNMYT